MSGYPFPRSNGVQHLGSAGPGPANIPASLIGELSSQETAEGA